FRYWPKLPSPPRGEGRKRASVGLERRAELQYDLAAFRGVRRLTQACCGGWSVRLGQSKAFAVQDVTQPGKKGRPMNGRTTAGLSVALGLWLGVAGARAEDGDWSPTSPPPAVVRARQ